MLLKIREKSQGVFAWIILLLICVPFALWGIQNYLGGGTETAIASVGDKEFYQQDLNRAYAQFSQSYAGMNIDETVLKKQALEKLIQDEVLFQHVQDEGLVASDQGAKDFIKSLEYFQTDGKFDKQKYKSLLASQRISSAEFVKRIKKALVMEQYQKSLMDSSFATQNEIDEYFKLQNQQRDVEIISIAVPEIKENPSDEEINNYFQQNQANFMTDEQVSIEYVELSLDNLAAEVDVVDEDLKAYYEEQKEQYTTKERRKISHMLFAFTKDSGADDKQLERALKAKESLKEKDFAELAAEISDDKLTASKGGDLGLFNVGEMDASFEEAALALKLGEVSDPVKSAFGYHLIKVTELSPSTIKAYDDVKDKLIDSFKKAKVENTFYELGQSLTEISYEHPDSLTPAADELGLKIHKTGLFSRNASAMKRDEKSIISDAKVLGAAFSEDVLKGNNSEAIELDSDRLVVLRMVEHHPASVKDLSDVKSQITATLKREKAVNQAKQRAEEIKNAVAQGKTMQQAADAEKLEVAKLTGLTRTNREQSWLVNQAIFKAAKPINGKPTTMLVAEPSGEQKVINLLSVTEGKMLDTDQEKLDTITKNMANAFGQAEFSAAMTSLRESSNVQINSAVN